MAAIAAGVGAMLCISSSVAAMMMGGDGDGDDSSGAGAGAGAGASTPTPEMLEMAGGKARGGGDGVGNPFKDLTLEECKTKCLGDDKCGSIAHNEATKDCYIKHVDVPGKPLQDPSVFEGFKGYYKSTAPYAQSTVRYQWGDGDGYIPGDPGEAGFEWNTGGSQTFKSCAEKAEEEGYPVFGYRVHGTDVTNNCFFYNKNKTITENSDNRFVMGCTDPSKSITNGCA